MSEFFSAIPLSQIIPGCCRACILYSNGAIRPGPRHPQQMCRQQGRLAHAGPAVQVRVPETPTKQEQGKHHPAQRQGKQHPALLVSAGGQGYRPAERHQALSAALKGPMQLLGQHMQANGQAAAPKVLEWTTPEYNEALAWLGAYLEWQARQERGCTMEGPSVSQRVRGCQVCGQRRSSGMSARCCGRAWAACRSEWGLLVVASMPAYSQSPCCATTVQ